MYLMCGTCNALLIYKYVTLINDFNFIIGKLHSVPV